MAIFDKSLGSVVVSLVLGLATAFTTWVYQRQQIEVEKAKAILEQTKQSHQTEMDYLTKAIDEHSTPETRRRVLRYLKLTPPGPLQEWARSELEIVETLIREAEDRLKSVEEARAKEKAEFEGRIKSLNRQLSDASGPKRKELERQLAQAQAEAKRVTEDQRKGERGVEGYQGRTVVCDGASTTTRSKLNPTDSAVADQFCRRVGTVPSEHRSPPSLWPDGRGITFDLGTTVNGVEVWCSCILP